MPGASHVASRLPRLVRRPRQPAIALALAFAVIALAAAGCGGSSSSATTSPATASTASTGATGATGASGAAASYRARANGAEAPWVSASRTYSIAAKKAAGNTAGEVSATAAFLAATDAFVAKLAALTPPPVAAAAHASFLAALRGLTPALAELQAAQQAQDNARAQQARAQIAARFKAIEAAAGVLDSKLG